MQKLDSLTNEDKDIEGSFNEFNVHHAETDMLNSVTEQ
jgi:hypothetical protein